MHLLMPSSPLNAHTPHHIPTPPRRTQFVKGHALAKIIRRMVFVEEQYKLVFKTDACMHGWREEVSDDDGTCQHSVGYFGDMPVATGRSRIVPQADGSRLVKFDRLCVLLRYRRRGVFSALLQHMVQAWSGEHGRTLHVSKCLVMCPVILAPHLERMLTAAGFQQVGAQCVDERNVAVLPLARNLVGL